MQLASDFLDFDHKINPANQAPRETEERRAHPTTAVDPIITLASLAIASWLAVAGMIEAAVWLASFVLPQG